MSDALRQERSAAPPALRIAMVSAFGTREGGYFSDVLLGLLCSDARALGHDATMVRVYYDGADRAADADVSARLVRWLVDRQIDLVVTDRVLTSEPFAQWKACRAGARMLLLPPPEGMGPVPVADAAIVHRPYERWSEQGEMGDEVRRAFAMWLATGLASPRDVDIPGLSAVHDGQPESPPRSLSAAAGGPALEYRPVVDGEVIAAAGGAAIAPAPYAVFGNGGCPYSRDVAQAKPYRDLPLQEPDQLLRKGCAFCTMGGDYGKRGDDDTVASVLRQVAYLTAHLPKPHVFVLTDQHPLRYLTRLLESAERRGIREVTWLLQTRADWLVEHREALVQGIAVAERTGMRLELYLIGFESFSDEDLELFNKGTTTAGLLAAVALARALARAHPDRFGFTRERGHSLILFHPWTSPERLLASGEALRAHGLSDFFHDVTRNRLRMYPRLPIFALAKAQGLAAEAWEGDEASRTARTKGYSVDFAWRFADSRAALAYEACRRLRGAFGDETQISQLLAVARWVGRMDRRAALAAESMRGLDAAVGRLSACFEELLHGSRGQLAAPVVFAGACNNGCPGCENHDRFLPDDAAALRERVDEARASGLPLMLAGREPTLHPDFTALVARAHGADARRIGVASNGRRFAYRRFAEEAIRAGLSDASVKIFAGRAAEADAVARVEGAFRQAVAGIDNLVRGGVRVEIRLPVHARALGTLSSYPELARAHRVKGIRLEVALDALGLDALDAAEVAVRALAAGCRAAGVRLTASPLPSGMRGFDRLPT
ncbi:MAG: radical SAM protein [Deltaproteobacteria bacterium]|nr:radical SAM protein [Deltaproteobacteria bacterium]